MFPLKLSLRGSVDEKLQPSVCVGTWIIDGDELALTIGMVSVLSS